MTAIEVAGEDDAHPIADGHIIHFMWERDAIRVFRVDCPNEDMSGLCNRRRNYCVVDRFIAAYGYEMNLGTVAISGGVEIAWVPIYGQSDLDNEFASIWMIPINDPDYQESFGAESSIDDLD